MKENLIIEEIFHASKLYYKQWFLMFQAFKFTNGKDNTLIMCLIVHQMIHVL